MSIKAKWYQRFQIEIGGRWQLFPDQNTSWRQWAFSPGCNLVWPGKEINLAKDWPDGTKRQSQLDIVDEPWDGVGLKKTHYFARYFWATCYLRLLGLDLGAAVIWLAQIRDEAT